jgi:DivIVA domain-containing protein
MDLTTELLDNAAFREAKRGYNTQEVDEFIEQVKIEYGRHEALLRDARQRSVAAESRATEAERRAAAEAERAASSSDADDTLKRTLVLAQRTADAAIKEAEEQADRTLSSAQDQAARMLADAQEATARARAEAETEARRAQEEARARVLAELHELEGTRDRLRNDVDALEKHIDDQRERVRVSTRELQRLLDDPASLRPAELPVISEVAVSAPPPPLVAPEPAPTAAPEPVPAPAPSVDDDPAGWTPDDSAWQAAEPEEGPPPSPAYAEEPDDGPSTESIDLDLSDEHEADDDAYLAELRKAMTDESPLGPREDDADDAVFDAGPEPSRSRFGRRR